MPISEVFNMDCMEYMKDIPDNFFDLAVVDPPYGIGASDMTMGKGKNKKYQKGKKWDSSPPNYLYFEQLFRVSINQIIWGGNYFNLPKTQSWIFWDKGIYGDSSFADGELAWTSFDKVLRIASIRYRGFLGMDKNRIHPTQKPVNLYAWILRNYANRGDKILDTHLGSGSNRIAAYKLGFDFYATEIDPNYFEDQNKRFDEECLGEQTLPNGSKLIQTSLFQH